MYVAFICDTDTIIGGGETLEELKTFLDKELAEGNIQEFDVDDIMVAKVDPSIIITRKVELLVQEK